MNEMDSSSIIHGTYFIHLKHILKFLKPIQSNKMKKNLNNMN